MQLYIANLFTDEICELGSRKLMAILKYFHYRENTIFRIHICFLSAKEMRRIKIK